MKKIIYFTTVPVPYKVAFFEELGKKCELTVVFENKTVSYREDSWMVTKFKNFRAFFLEGLNVKGKKISSQAVSFLKKEKFDHIIIGCYSTFAQMKAQCYLIRHKIPYIISSDGGMIKNDKGFQKRLKCYFIGHADMWLSTGRITSEYLAHYGADPQKTYSYPFTSIKNEDVLTVPDTYPQKLEFRERLSIEEKNVDVCVGQFIHRKGMDLLIQAAPSLKDTGVYIIGGKPDNMYLELKEKCGADHVHFVAFKDKAALSEYYRAADVFVLPTREDIWGLVVNEAMAYGLPVITTDRCVAGMEMVENGITGSIIPSDDVQQLSDAIRKWLEHKEDICTERILQTARNYTTEKMAEVHYVLLESNKNEEDNDVC